MKFLIKLSTGLFLILIKKTSSAWSKPSLSDKVTSYTWHLVYIVRRALACLEFPQTTHPTSYQPQD